jgi:uncharacterized protein Usg
MKLPCFGHAGYLFQPQMPRIVDSDRSPASCHPTLTLRDGLDTALPRTRPVVRHTWETTLANTKHSTDQAFLAQLRGFSLTTAEILYRLPDHPALLQSFVWQDYDLSPKFPKLKKFLDFWTQNLDGPLYGIRIAHAGLIKPAELKLIDGEFKLN